MSNIKCPNCRSLNCFTFYRVSQPVSENILYLSKKAALEASKEDIELVFCKDCGFVFNQLFDPAKLEYNKQYQYTQPPTPHFKDFIQQIAEDLINSYNLHNKQIVEIGCGKGDFLHLLCRLGNNKGVGFDTSYEGPLEVDNGKIKFFRKYINSSTFLKSVPDLICSRQVIEHIPKPAGLLSTIKQTIGNSSKTVVFFETPDFSWILKNTAIWDIYYEHCSYFTQEFLVNLFRTNGFQILRSEKVFGNQYLRLDAKLTLSPDKNISSESLEKIEQEVNNFAIQSKRQFKSLRSKCKNYSAKGPWVIWGGAAKGVTFCNLIGKIAGNALQVVDINPLRQGKFVPITGHPIISPDQLLEIRPHTVLVMNQNYLKEIEKDLKDRWIEAKVVCLDDLK